MSEETERHQRDHQPISTSDDHVSFTQDQGRTSTSFLWQIPIPSLWSIAQRYAGRGQNAGLDPSNGALPGFVHLLLGSQLPFECYAQESRLASEFVAGGDLPAVAVPTRPMLKKYRGDYFVKANDWFPLLSAKRWTSLFELAEASWHQDDSLHVAIILLTMALGAAPDQPDSSVTSSPAHSFFRQAVRMVGRAMTFTPALEIAQAKFLIGFVRDYLVKSSQLKNKPLVVEELQSQLEKWKQILPEDIQFSIADCRPLFDDHREFLRMQFHCAQALLCWPTIVSVIDAIEQGSETPLAAESATKCNLFAASAVMIFQGAVEQLCSRTVVTWLVCEA
ncbi:hypothetical protein CGLO_11726 [Colletotrichum gloeosporioides Cg-14]|uniref:Uncharacterized protein n=1 Tax=Colletotrichum gloeosporioides (strain Cg-14) TaxID=1237896 RepID=T0LB83_COLGC|nr:hypothetical protein CGLO_11726 [Colletotrichum gloeosporioides Cg-14]